MTWNVKSIEAIAERVYRVVLAREVEMRTFVFRVEQHRGIELVVSELAFDEFIGLQRPGAESLLAAVLAFHNAREVTVNR